MQAVHKDGTLGPIMEYDGEKLAELIGQAHVDHVRVFAANEGNEVGLSDIAEKDLERKIEEVLASKFEFHIKRKQILLEYAAVQKGGGKG